MIEKEIFQYLYNLGCCKACCLRYILVKCQETYNNMDKYIKELKYLEENDISEVTESKKVKTNPCIICLGLLQSFCIDNIVDKAFLSEKVKAYDSKVFTCAVSYPMCIQIREKSIMIDLDRRFPDFYTCETVVTALNKTWKWLIKDKLASKLNRTFEPSEICVFSINFTIGFELESQELSLLQEMQPKFFNIRKEQKRKFREGIFSRKSTQAVLEMTNIATFSKFFSVPPTVPDKELFVEQIDCVHNSIYIAGRYCKYSRELSQTPWIINGVKMMETSVQELIFEPFLKLLQIPEDGLKFSSSGREDVDVRCLGKGRPFYLEYLDPKKTEFTYEEFRQIEEQINANITILVRDLQLVAREDLTYVKEGEENKTKQYEAVCICKDAVPTEEQLNNLENLSPVHLNQKTPIRVLHRRPLATRQRTIFSMKAEKILNAEENIFKLFLTTQAGTYVKEFVHGDFGRTVPNISELLNTEVDIMELDVTSIDLDWPKPVEKLTL